MSTIKAKTFVGDETEITVDVLMGPNAAGLCKVAYGARVLVRHIDRLVPLNDETRRFLGK